MSLISSLVLILQQPSSDLVGPSYHSVILNSSTECIYMLCMSVLLALGRREIHTEFWWGNLK